MTDADDVSSSISLDKGHIQNIGRNYYIDENIVTFNSPDIEFDSQLSNLDWNDCKLRIIGATGLYSISGDIDIRTATPTASSSVPGFIHNMVGFP